MKHMKKFLSVALVLALALALAVPAFAAEPPTAAKTGSITVNNAVEGKNYRAYRLLDLSLNDSKEHYGYTVNNEWKAFFEGAGAQYVQIDTTHGNVTFKGEMTAATLQEFAQAARGYATQNSGTVTAYEPKGTVPTLIFENLPLGYYLVATDSGALQALDTTNTAVVMYEKNNTEPKIEKTADKTNAAYGEKVNFTIPVTRAGYVWGDYVITDTMTGLKMDESSVQLTVDGQTLKKDTDYEVKFPQPADEPQVLTVTIKEETLNKRNDTDYLYPEGTVFTLTYSAVAQKVVEMENKAILEYSTKPGIEKPDGQTSEDSVKIANYEFFVKKTDEKNTALDGATFELHKQKDCADDAMRFVVAGSTYRLADENEKKNAVSEITAGSIKIEGLAAGTYYLKEIKAPDGYNKLLNPVEIVITENLNSEGNYKGQAFDNNGKRLDPTITVGDQTLQNPFEVQVINKTGTELPSTGGIGTTIFYVVGGLMMIAAAVALVVKKRMEH